MTYRTTREIRQRRLERERQARAAFVFNTICLAIAATGAAVSLFGFYVAAQAQDAPIALAFAALTGASLGAIRFAISEGA